MGKDTALQTLNYRQAELIRAQAATADAVAAAVKAGASWTEIGTSLGISKQTAHARYGKGTAAATKLRQETTRSTEAKDRAALRNITSKISDTEVAGDSVTPSIFSDAPAPATAEEWTDPRPGSILKSAGMIDGVAQPGTGKGPHQCPRCGSNNHKSGKPDVVYAYMDCPPTKYDPQDITDHLNSTGLSKKAGTK